MAYRLHSFNVNDRALVQQFIKVPWSIYHGLDIIHPPIWYWCWLMGLGIDEITFLSITLPVIHWMWILFAVYVGGRIFEGLFQLFFNDISIFCWKPIDSFHRLITARRNPCKPLILLKILYEYSMGKSYLPM